MALVTTPKSSSGSNRRSFVTVSQKKPSPTVAVQVRRAVSALPGCIERVATSMGACYNPMPVQARINLHADEFSIRAYLGTYLPRTVFEFITIGSDILAHPTMRRAIPTNRPLRILDLGSGTGGAWMGMVTALQKNGFRQAVNVYAVDGNNLALSKQRAFASAMTTEMGIEIRLTTHHCELSTDAEAFANDLYNVLKGLDMKYDFVLVSKHLSEFYCSSGQRAHGIVFEALQLLQPALLSTGYLVMLDLTTRIDEVGEYFPNILARELGGYLDQCPNGMHPVLPIPCAVSAQRVCAGKHGKCFSQRELTFFHSIGRSHGAAEATTRVAYRVLAQCDHARNITAGYSRNSAYQVNARQKGLSCHHGQIVSHPNAVNGYVPLINCTK